MSEMKDAAQRERALDVRRSFIVQAPAGSGKTELLVRRFLKLMDSVQTDKDLSLPVHQIFLVVNGIHILENLKLDELAAKRVYEFAFTMQPLKIYGASGSSVAPAAIR